MFQLVLLRPGRSPLKFKSAIRNNAARGLPGHHIPHVLLPVVVELKQDMADVSVMALRRTLPSVPSLVQPIRLPATNNLAATGAPGLSGANVPWIVEAASLTDKNLVYAMVYQSPTWACV